MGVEYPAIMRSRYRKAAIPVRLRGILEDHALVQAMLARCLPSNAVSGYAQAFRDGQVLRAEGRFKTCGKGLWLRGGEEADVIAAAVLQTLLLQEVVESGMYLSVHDLIEGERPGGSPREGALDCDLVVLQGAGDHYRTESGWSDSVVSGFLRRRFDRGLPTIVPSLHASSKSGLPESLCRSAFVEVLVQAGE